MLSSLLKEETEVDAIPLNSLCSFHHSLLPFHTPYCPNPTTHLSLPILPPFVRTLSHQSSFSVKVIYLWNSLPNSIVTSLTNTLLLKNFSYSYITPPPPFFILGWLLLSIMLLLATPDVLLHRTLKKDIFFKNCIKKGRLCG